MLRSSLYAGTAMLTLMENLITKLGVREADFSDSPGLGE